MLFERLVDTSGEVARRGSRLAKIESLVRLLADTDSALLEATVSMLAGELPTGRIGVGYRTVADAIADLPEDAAGEPPSLTEVLAVLEEVRDTSGPGSVARRKEALRALFARLAPAGRRFLLSVIVGELRQGALEGVMLEAVSRTAEVELDELRRAAMLAGSFADVSKAVLIRGPEALADFGIELFRPLQPMLAQPAETVSEAIERMSPPPDGDDPPGVPELAIETKIDGARVQVHRRADEVRVYSRRLRDVTGAVPEVVEAALRVEADPCILDGETFAVDEEGAVHDFQTTMRRFGRKLDVDRLREELPLRVRFFDALLLGAAPRTEAPDAAAPRPPSGGTEAMETGLIDLSYRERWSRMARAVPADLLIDQRLSDTPSEMIELLERALAEGHEGIMVKDPSSTYAAGSRGRAWLKVKPTHTVDLVVLGAEWGHGRRRGFLSNLHLGAPDPETGEMVMLGKTFKGLTDELLRWQTDKLLELETRREGIAVFVEPRLVVEIAFNDVQESPQYPGGMALRFARVRRYREDKTPAEATTVDEIRDLHLRSRGALEVS